MGLGSVGTRRGWVLLWRLCALLSEFMPVQQIDTVCTPSQAINSVSSVVAILPASPLCSEREDSFTGVADSIYVPMTEEAKIDRIPSPAKGLIRRGFFGPRVVSPSTSGVKEAFVSSQSFKDDSTLGVVDLCKVREASPVRAVESISLSSVKAVKKLALVEGLIWGF